jgi:hypothetical protein
MSRALVLLLLLLVPAGCGGSSNSSAANDLRITVWPQGKASASIGYTLGCPGGTGTLPEARAACSKLQRIGASAFAPVPPGMACTEIYGGPQVARVSGRLAGRSISADFSRNDGCQIERWGRLAFLFQTGS